MNNKRKKRNHKFLFQISFKKLCWFICVIIFFVTFFLLFQISKIRKIECILVDAVCPSQLAEKLQLDGSSIFFEDIEKSILLAVKDQPVVFDHLERKLPDKVIVYFDKTEFAYQLQFTDQLITVDELGNIFYTQEEVANQIEIKDDLYPLLVENSKIKNKINNQLLLFFSKIEEADLKIEKISFNSKNTIAVQFRDYPIVLFEPETIGAKISDLLLIKKEQIDQIENEIKEIDMRFDFPILREFNSLI